MSEFSGFFNSLKNEAGEYDRRYSSEDYCSNLAVVINNGVLRSINNDLKPTVNGLKVTIGYGRAWINGHYYLNSEEIEFNVPTPPISGQTRHDRVMLRLDASEVQRRIYLIYRQGDGEIPPEPIRAENIYELCICTVDVPTNTSIAHVNDTRSDKELCGWVYSTAGDNSFFETLDDDFFEWFNERKDTLSSVTLYKQYVWSTVTLSETATVTFDIPQYDQNTCYFDVYINGMREKDFTHENNVITFDVESPLTAGTEITVVAFKSIDGTGIMDISDEITELQNRVDALTVSTEWDYKCTGLNDNVHLSQIAQAFYNKGYIVEQTTEIANQFLQNLGGNAFLSAIGDEAHFTINVIGNAGITSPAQGTGSSISPYNYFFIGSPHNSEMQITFDFAKCNFLSITHTTAETDETFSNVFSGVDIFVKNAKVVFNTINRNCNLQIFTSLILPGNCSFENCTFKINGTKNCTIANHGRFINCNSRIKTAGNANSFDCDDDKLIIVENGVHSCHTTSDVSSDANVFCIKAGKSNAVILARDVSLPIISSIPSQHKFSATGQAGNITIDGLISTLPYRGSYVNVSNLININKKF